MAEVAYLSIFVPNLEFWLLILMRIASNSNLPHRYLDVMDINHSLDEFNVINVSLPIKYWERKRCGGWRVA
jgi:hypothetical protein